MSRPRHVVLVHRYFYPDTPPYASILHSIALRLGEAGHRVTVLTCQPSYNRQVVRRAPRRERIHPHVTVRRWAVLDDRSSSVLKVLNLIWFALRLLVAGVLLRRVDTVMAASTPPLVLARCGLIVARMNRARFVYHKQDIYPEVTVGLGSRPGVAFRMMRAIDADTDRRSDAVVVLSRDMAQTVARRGVAEGSIHVLNNFDPWADDADTEDEPRRQDRPDRLVVAFAGNLGRFQGLETLFEAARKLAGSPIDFHFFGQGPLTADAEGLAADGVAVTLHGYRSPSEVASFLRDEADLGVVSLAPGVIDCAYPSKTLSYLRRGTPILALVEGGSELADQVDRGRLGIQVEPGDGVGLAHALEGLATDPTALEPSRDRCREFYRSELAADVRLAQWVDLLGSSPA